MMGSTVGPADGSGDRGWATATEATLAAEHEGTRPTQGPHAKATSWRFPFVVFRSRHPRPHRSTTTIGARQTTQQTADRLEK